MTDNRIWTSSNRLPQAAWGFLLVFAALHALAVFTENVNWDEFALLDRAVRTLRTGQLEGGGRPGLATAILLPFAQGCRNALDRLVHARVFWLLPVYGGAAAFWYLMRLVLPASPHRGMALVTSLALWVLAPHFLRYSLQVRADQPAILFGLLAAAALLGSLYRPILATAAGAGFGVAFLFSQKAAYIGLLAGALVAGQLLLHGTWSLRRELLRGSLAAACFALIVILYRLLLGRYAQSPSVLPVSGGLATFDYYLEFVGWRHYWRMLPALFPQLLMLGALLFLTLNAASRGSIHSRRLVAAWMVVGAGTIVLLFHAGRFPYFYMTIGLFPAAVAALVYEPWLTYFSRGRLRQVPILIVWIPLAFGAATEALLSLQDTQQIQRRSLVFIERSFPPESSGFEGRAALTCRNDPKPFRVFFNEHLVSELRGPEGEGRVRTFLEEFRARPVAFMIAPTGLYPPAVLEFWRTRYVSYYAAVWIPGRRIESDTSWTSDFEVIVPGTYTWHSGAGRPLIVDGRTVNAGNSVQLGRGQHQLALTAAGRGLLALHVPVPPAPDSTPFYRQF